MTQRRRFIKQISLAGAGINLITPLNFVSPKNRNDTEPVTEKKTITLLQTTDVHCQIHSHDELFWENEKMVFRKTAGYAHLATIFKRLRKKNTDTFIVDTGDMFQGSMLSVKTLGGAYTEILNSLGYDLYLPGNWEVIYHKNRMQTLLGGLHSPKVCANMYHDAGDGQKGELIFPPYYTWAVQGIKIGFLGYTDHLVPIRQSPIYSKGIVYTKAEDNLAYYIDILKNQEKCDYIILLAHLGLSQQLYLADHPACEGVNYIFGGDTHERVRIPIQCKYAKVVEPGAFGSFVGKLDLLIENGKIVKDHYELLEVNPKKYPADKEMERIMVNLEKPYTDKINIIHGYSTLPLYRYFVIENTIDTLIVDALMWKANTDIVVSNGFRFCPPRAADASGLVPITEGYIFDMLPVDAQARKAKVNGRQIIEWLEKELQNVFAKEAGKRFGGWVVKMKGMSIQFKVHEEMGKRLQSVKIGNSNLDPEKWYSIAACEREGDPENVLCRIPNVSEAQNLPFTMHQVMRDFVKNHSPVNPSPPGNVRVLDEPQSILSQVFREDYKFV